MKFFFFVSLFCVFAVSAQQAFNVTGPLTVSGLSAGGFMASQFHVAFSSAVSGAAIFAGGP
jgi:poly(3-hydroxybutyrate) depolymerase